MTTYTTLLISDRHGVYIPQVFAETIDWNALDNWNEDQKSILLDGPDNESYWDAWQEILDNCETVDGGRLHQDGDVWVVYVDKAISDLNAYLNDQLEYETSHPDAGDNYAYIVADSTDSQDIQRQLDEEILLQLPNQTALDSELVKKLDLNLRGLPIARVIDLALDCFNMVPGHMFGPYEDGLILAAFPIQEIETEIPDSFDDIVLGFIGDNGSDAYIKGRFAYMSTDAVWYAVASVKALQAAIDQEVTQD
jgi:hypothetical protein